jgi:hypothetical protein
MFHPMAIRPEWDRKRAPMTNPSGYVCKKKTPCLHDRDKPIGELRYHYIIQVSGVCQVFS